MFKHTLNNNNNSNIFSNKNTYVLHACNGVVEFKINDFLRKYNLLTY